VKAPVQYGHRIRAVGTYLHVYHLLPFERLGEVFGDLFGCKLATGTLTNFIKDASIRATPVYERIRGEIISSDFMHNDETGLKILDKTSWLHVASTPKLAFFEVTAGRSFEDIKSVGVLEGYTGRSIHDFLPAYLKFEGLKHGLCNVHHLRDLTFIEEQYAQQWPVEMKALLLEMKKLKDREQEGSRKVGVGTTARLRTRYAEILSNGRVENPEPKPIPKKRGRPARGKPLNILDRFTNYEEEILSFLIHGVPFDNNEAERDLRMMKTRQKISGCFRSLEWSKRFAKIRSVITTGKKRSANVYELLQHLFSDPLEAEKLLLYSTTL
jgi:transposase